MSQKENNIKIRYCIWLTKEERLKYLSHHDTALVLEQSLRRAHLPVCMGGKYNPRLKISFFSSVPVGIATEGEPMDIYFYQDIEESHIQQALNKNLPDEMQVKKVQKIESRESLDLKILYTIKTSFLVTETLAMDASSIWVTRIKKDKKTQVDVRNFIKECKIEHLNSGTIIYLETLMTSRDRKSVV